MGHHATSGFILCSLSILSGKVKPSFLLSLTDLSILIEQEHSFTIGKLSHLPQKLVTTSTIKFLMFVFTFPCIHWHFSFTYGISLSFKNQACVLSFLWLMFSDDLIEYSTWKKSLFFDIASIDLHFI